MTTRAAFVLTLGAILAAAWYGVRLEGQPRPVDPLRVWTLPEVPAWQPQPTLLRKSGDPAAIYVVSGLPASDGRFDALRGAVPALVGPVETYRSIPVVRG